MTSTSIELQTKDLLKGQELTKVIGRKPTSQDIDLWEEELATQSAQIKVRSIPEGMQFGLLAAVIPQEEYALEIEDEDFEWEEPTDLGPYPELDGTEDDQTIKTKEAEHKSKNIDAQKYIGFTQHAMEQFQRCMDACWIETLKKNRTGFNNVTVHQVFNHLRTTAAKLSTKEKQALKEAIKIEWNRGNDIATFFKDMEDAQWKAEKWGVDTSTQEMVNHAVSQMEDSGLFEDNFLMDWEEKEEHEQTWETMKTYYTKEYRKIQRYSKTKRVFESANNIEEAAGGQDVSNFFEELRKDAIVGNEQINQMTTAFKGATETMGETLDRLKTALATIDSQNKVIANLTNTNKQLTDNNTKLTDAVAKGNTGGGGDNGGRQRFNRRGNNDTSSDGEKCPICKGQHTKPHLTKCWELESNKEQRPANWKSVL